MKTLSDSRGVTHVGKLYCHLSLEVQQLDIAFILRNPSASLLINKNPLKKIDHTRRL
jgi:hypothetical protein